jgi:hypothetical protein
VATVRVRFVGQDWFHLVEGRGGDCWSGPLPGDRLSKGEHTLEVEAFDVEGRRAGQTILFIVDPTGRYTAVPTAHPRVTQTAFC